MPRGRSSDKLGLGVSSDFVEAVLNGNQGSLQLFLRGFAARDLADPFATEPPAVDLAAVIDETASFNDVIQGLNAAPCLYVRSRGKIAGVISRRDVQKPAMRMWLFGLITISEQRVTQYIEECCPGDAWQTYLSPARLQKAAELQRERRRRGQDPSLIDCLQFADKGQIVARDERLRELTRFSSKRQVEGFVAALQDLRNNLAHSQDISGNWEVIHELATNLYRIVLGPEHQANAS